MITATYCSCDLCRRPRLYRCRGGRLYPLAGTSPAATYYFFSFTYTYSSTSIDDRSRSSPPVTIRSYPPHAGQEEDNSSDSYSFPHEHKNCPGISLTSMSRLLPNSVWNMLSAQKTNDSLFTPENRPISTTALCTGRPCACFFIIPHISIARPISCTEHAPCNTAGFMN